MDSATVFALTASVLIMANIGPGMGAADTGTRI